MIEANTVVAHRGASAYAPENTISAFRKARELGAQWVEFDVMMAACGELIVFHDETLQRTTNGKGDVARTPYEEIKHLDAGSWFSAEFAGLKVPTFVEVMQCLEELGLKANVEIKPTFGAEKETTVRTVELIKNMWPKTLPLPLITCFHHQSLQWVRMLAPELPIGFIAEAWNDDYFRIAEKYHCVSVHLADNRISFSNIEKIRKKGYHVLVYTVNKAARVKELFAHGVDGVFSDYPDVMKNSA